MKFHWHKITRGCPVTPRNIGFYAEQIVQWCSGLRGYSAFMVAPEGSRAKIKLSNPDMKVHAIDDSEARNTILG
jgi:hypothetical protein